jgi:hypothetical protein
MSQHSRDATERARRAIDESVSRQKRIREQRQKRYKRGAKPEPDSETMKEKELYRRDRNARNREKRAFPRLNSVATPKGTRHGRQLRSSRFRAERRRVPEGRHPDGADVADS